MGILGGAGLECTLFLVILMGHVGNVFVFLYFELGQVGVVFVFGIGGGTRWDSLRLVFKWRIL